eukprot:scaffold56129_cov69-Phaeocystis_antarctica.AAC.1
MRKNIRTNGPNWGETSSTRMTRSQRRKTATTRKDVAVASSLSPVDTNATSAASEKISAMPSTRLMWSAQSPLPTQTSSSGATDAVARSAAGMSVSARARARSAAHSRPNLMTGRCMR